MHFVLSSAVGAGEDLGALEILGETLVAELPPHEQQASLAVFPKTPGYLEP